MATVIDSLVTELKLDTTDFMEGERRAAQIQRRLLTTAASTGQTMERTAQRSIKDYLTGFEKQFTQIDKRLGDLGASSRRTGQSIRSGGQEGATGLAAMATSALEAFAAIKGLQVVYDKLLNTAGATAQTARTAYFANVPLDWLSKVQIYSNIKGNVSPQAVNAAINTLAQQQAAFRNTGQYSEQSFIALQRKGIDFMQPIPVIMQQLAKALAGSSGADVKYWLSQTPLGALAPAMVGGEAAWNRGLAAQGYLAVTPEQARAALELQSAVNQLEEHFEHMYRVLNVELNPELTSFLHTLELFSDFVADHAAVILRILNLMSFGAVGGGPQSLPGSLAPPSGKNDTRNFWQRIAPSILGGKPEPTGGAAPAAGAGSPGGVGSGATFMPPEGGSVEQMIRQTVAAAGGNEFAQAGALAAMNAESGLNPANVAPGGDTGVAQWVGSRKRRLQEIAREMGTTVADPRAQMRLLYEELSTPAGRAMIQKMNGSGSATAAGKVFGFDFEQGGAAPGLFGGGGLSQNDLDRFHSKGAEEFYRRGQATSPAPSAWGVAVARQLMGITAARAGGTTSSSVDRHVDNDVNATVHVYGNNSDGYVLGGRIGDAIKARMTVNSSDVGLE